METHHFQNLYMRHGHKFSKVHHNIQNYERKVLLILKVVINILINGLPNKYPKSLRFCTQDGFEEANLLQIPGLSSDTVFYISFLKSYYQIQILQLILLYEKLIGMLGKSQQKSYHQIQILQIMLLHEKLICKCEKSQQNSYHQIQILQYNVFTLNTDRYMYSTCLDNFTISSSEETL